MNGFVMLAICALPLLWVLYSLHKSVYELQKSVRSLERSRSRIINDEGTGADARIWSPLSLDELEER